MKFKNLNNFITNIPGNYLAEMAQKNVAFVGNCKDIYTYFQKINKNCKYFSITKQNWKSVVKSLTKKDKNNMPKFDVIVGNPPFYEEKPEGKKRAAPHLDSKIWLSLCENTSRHIIMVMSHGCNRMKNMGYTYMSEQFPFPGAAIDVNIFERKSGEKEIDIVSKYETNGKYEWLKNNQVDKYKSLSGLVVNFKPEEINDFTVPETYFAYHERSGKNIRTFVGGERTVKENGTPLTCIDYIKCKSQEQAIQLKEWFDKNVTPKYKEFTKFGDCNVNRGFLQTIEIPSFMKD
jgi:hypothetical protein